MRLTHKIADWITGGKLSGAEKAEVERDALKAEVERLLKIINEIWELNLTGRDENGHRWANSDLIDQAVMEARGAWINGGTK